MWVESLVWELRSHVPCSTAEKNKKYGSFHPYHLKLEGKFQKLVLIQLIIYMCEYVYITCKYL